MSFETAKDLLMALNVWVIANASFITGVVFVAVIFGFANYLVRDLHHRYLRFRWNIHARHKDAWDKLRRSLYAQRTKSGRTFMREERKDEILSMVADVICDRLEDAEHHGKISTEEKYYIYRRLANVCGLHDLVPTNYILLKDRIRNRIDRRKLKPSAPEVPEEIEVKVAKVIKKRSLLAPNFKTAAVKTA